MISFRSTEFDEDGKKDFNGAVVEIGLKGTAIAQTISMVHYVEYLKSKKIIKPGTEIELTGYSLGSQLASTFFKMYENELNITNLISFNGPGAGVVNLKANPLAENPYKELKNEILETYNSNIDLFTSVRYLKIIKV